MSATNFWNNFKNGFLDGMFFNSPLFGCFNGFNGFNNLSVFGGWNCGFMGFGGTSPSLFLTPNFNAGTSFQLMSDIPMPQANFNFDTSKMFNNNIWNNSQAVNIPSNFNFGSNWNNFPTTDFNWGSFGDMISKSSTGTIGKMGSTSVNEKYFDKMLKYIHSQEGGYAYHPADNGGATCKGVIQTTYDSYRKRNNLPTQSVKNISDAEARAIAHEIFVACGADKIDNPRVALMVFDIAYGSGAAKAKEMFKKSGGDINKLETLRREFYSNIVRRRPSQKVFLKGWNNRTTHTMEFAKNNLPETSLA